MTETLKSLFGVVNRATGAPGSSYFRAIQQQLTPSRPIGRGSIPCHVAGQIETEAKDHLSNSPAGALCGS